MKNVSIIVAASSNNVIGKSNDLPWSLPSDLKRFKTLTTGKPVLMGRKCWESIPVKFRPLPNRLNIVITRDESYTAEGCEIRHNLKDAIEEFSKDVEELFVIGGSEIYKESFPYANKLYLTRISEEVEGDIYLEGLVPSDWLMVAFEGPYNESDLNYTFQDYEKKD